MRYWILLLFLALIGEVRNSHAQAPATTATATADTIRIGIIPLSNSAEFLSDILTAELSSKPGLVILERSQMQKIAQEQNLSLLSSGQKSDYLKLGQILGADGLVLLDLEQSVTVTNQLEVRLVAVKPGVLLLSKKFSWPLEKPAEWVSGLSPVLAPYFPKLSVLPKDAMPLSILNLRSAVQSAEAHELEHQLTLLAIERFSHEKQVFVLERRNLNLAASEKERKDVDDSAFWNGNYLLEGTIDRDGVNPSKVTLHARLVPPKAAEAIIFEIEGSRTNLPSLVGPLANKVLAALKLTASPSEWSAKAEADRYLAEANWAIKWSAYAEAASAADSAWALGRQDLDVATARIKARMLEVGKIPYYESKPPESYKIPLLVEQQRFYVGFSKSYSFPSNVVPQNWIQLGISILDKGGQLLQYALYEENYNKLSESDLRELRVHCRNLQAYLQSLPSVAAQYEVGDKLVSHDSLGDLSSRDNFFNIIARIGYSWQEGPVESVAFYRKLMESKAFHFLHQEFWGQYPTIFHASAAWNAKDKRAIPEVWSKFREELKASPDFHAQLEGQALDIMDEREYSARVPRFEKLVETLIAHGHEMAAENGEMLYLDWGVRYVMPSSDSLATKYKTNYGPILSQFNAEFWNKTVQRFKGLEKRRKRMEVLRNNVILPWHEYSSLFSAYAMSDAEKEEVKPFLETYATFLTNSGKIKLTGLEQNDVNTGLRQITELQRTINIVRAPSKPGPAISKAVTAPQSPVRPTLLLTPRRKATLPITSAEAAWIPLSASALSLQKTDEELRKFRLISSRVVSSNLVLHVRADWTYVTKRIIDHDREGKRSDFVTTSGYTRFGLAILQPGAADWQFIVCPDEPDPDLSIPGMLINNPDACLFQNCLYVARMNTLLCGDLSIGRWQTNAAPWDRVPRFSVVADRLYAATDSVIAEVLQEGKETKILASARRRPAVSSLDNLDRLGSYVFEGPGHSLRAVVDYGVYAWTGEDWEKLSRFPAPGMIDFLEGSIFLTGGWSAMELYALTPEDTNPVLLFSKAGIESSSDIDPVRQTTDADRGLFSVPGYYRSHYYFLWDPRMPANDASTNRHATLYRYPKNLKNPHVLDLKFAPEGHAGAADKKASRIQEFDHFVKSQMLFVDDDIIFIKPGTPGVYRLLKSDLAPAFLSDAESLHAPGNSLAAEYSKNPDSFFGTSRLKAAFDNNDLGIFVTAQVDPKHSGVIDPKVLSHLDGNHDGILQPAEEEAVLLLSDLVAYYAFMNADLNGNGLLEREEATAFPSIRLNNRMGKGAIFKDFGMEVQKMNEARIRGAATRLSPDRGEGPMPFGIKAIVEDYWKREKAAKKNAP